MRPSFLNRSGKLVKGLPAQSVRVNCGLRHELLIQPGIGSKFL